MKRTVRMLALVIVGFMLLVVVLLGGCQRSMIYLARPYDLTVLRVVDRYTEKIHYEIGAGRQVAFYVPPAEEPEAAPDRLWILVGGNGSLALDWLDLVELSPDPRAGYLLVDYPGYGYNMGSPTRDRIREGLAAAFAAAAQRFEMDESELARRTMLMGHSLGAAAALELAVALEPAPRRIVLIAPFSSMMDMARISVGWPLCHMLLDRFDNHARLADLARLDERPALTIIHGNADNIVPVRMGRELAKPHEDWVEYLEIHGGDHNWILQTARQEILDRMRPSPDDAPYPS